MDEEEESCAPVDTDAVTLSVDIDAFQWKPEDKVILNGIHEVYQGGDRIFISGESGRGAGIKQYFRVCCINAEYSDRDIA